MRYLLTVWPFPGCLHPFLAVARALSARGHEVAVYTAAERQATVEREGLTWFPFDPALERRLAQLVFSPESIGANWTRAWKIPALLRDFFVSTVPLQLAGLDPVVRDWKPDAILCDPAMLGPFLILHETTGIPVAILTYSLGCFLPGRDIPPVGLGLPHRTGTLARAGNRIAGRLLALFLRELREGANDLRRQYGLPAIRGPILQLARRLPLYLVGSCRELDYPREDLPGSVHYVGECAWYPTGASPEWLSRLSPDRRYVHVSEGTMHVAEPFLLRAARKGLAGENVDVVMTTGPYRTLDHLGLTPLPANFRVETWIDHDALMPKMSAVVCTGNAGTILAALRRGVPVVIVPTEWDHNENAQRVAQSGAGIRLARSLFSPGRLQRAVRRVLDDPSYRKNAVRLSAVLDARPGGEVAAGLLEEMARGSQTPNVRM